MLPLVFALFFAAVELCQANSLQHVAQAAACERATVSVTPTSIQSTTRQVTVTGNVPFRENSLVASRVLARSTLTSSCTLNRELSE